MKRLFVPAERLLVGRVEVSGADHHYLSRVLRATLGETVTLFDGAGREGQAMVAQVGPETMALEVGGIRAAPAGPELVLVVGLLKGEKMDWVVQKATELGATRIVPAATRNAVARVTDDARGAAKAERWRKIAREAARQAGRAAVPQVDEVTPLATALALVDGWKVLFHEAERGRSLRALLPAEPPAAVVAAVGPEGGFAPDEVEAARATGYAIAGLGRWVLRAETAALAAVALLRFVLDEQECGGERH